MFLKFSNNSILFIFFLFSCAYYNTFYNAQKAFKDAEEIINQTKKTEDGSIPEQAKKLLSSSIEKSQKVINKFPESKYIDDALFLIGKSSFLKEDYIFAKKYFNQLLLEFPNGDLDIETKIWLA